MTNIPRNSEAVLSVTKKPAGTFVVEAKRKLNPPTHLLVARGIVEVLLNKSFHFAVMNITKKTITETKSQSSKPDEIPHINCQLDRQY